ncbi:MAG: sugar ABC transporter substrate-binding protein [Sphaerochaetaceae bacterium]|nr:sugar ABC transporter substrate-binding protein [Sphaerochaetaceae bacterium]
MRKNHIYKILTTIAIALLLTNSVFAQGSKEEDMIITLKMEQYSATNSNASGPALEEMIAEFEKQNPEIKVELQTIGYNDYFTQLQSKVVGGNAADVFELNFENFVSYASQDTLSLLDGKLGDTSGFNQTALKAFEYENQQYGVPNSFSNVLLFYNKELFDKAGIEYPTDSWTWDDIEKAGAKIRALGKDTFGFYRPLTFHEFYKAAAQNGSSLMNENYTEFTINTTKNIEVAQRMADWQIKSNIMPTDAQLGGMGDWDLFKSGRLGMLVTGIWAFNDFSTNCPFDWDVTVEPGNTNKASHFFSNAYVISKTSEHKEEAIKLATFLAGSKEAAKIRVNAAWELPPVEYEEVLQQYLNSTPPNNKQAVFDSLNYLVTPPVVQQQAEMTAIIGDYLNKIIYQTMDAKTALNECQKELEKKISLQ